MSRPRRRHPGLVPANKLYGEVLGKTLTLGNNAALHVDRLGLVFRALGDLPDAIPTLEA